MGFFSPGRTPSTMKPVPSSRAVGSTSGVGLQVSGCSACPPGPWASATHCAALDSTALYPSLVHITIISRPCSTLHHSTIMYPILCCPLPTLPCSTLLYPILLYPIPCCNQPTLTCSIVIYFYFELLYPILLFSTLIYSTPRLYCTLPNSTLTRCRRPLLRRPFLDCSVSEVQGDTVRGTERRHAAPHKASGKSLQSCGNTLHTHSIGALCAAAADPNPGLI